MQTFKYKATTAEGNTIEGTHLANNRDDVVVMLREKKHYPIKVEEFHEGKDIKDLSFSFGKSVKTKDIAIFCRQFYTMLNAGISIVASLDILRRQTDNGKLREEIAGVYEDVQKGQTLSEAMKNRKRTFPGLLLNMVEAGEVSGNLDAIMSRLASHFEKENKINNKVKTAMVYPIILSVLAVGVVVFLLTFVMPTFIGMFEGSGVALPLPTRILLDVSNILTTYWYIFTVFIIIAIVGFKAFITTEAGRYSFDEFKLKLPVIKETIKKISTSRFSRTLSTLLASGIPLLEALDIVSRVVGNKVLEKGILKSIDEVRRGSTLAKPIKAIGFFPPMLDSMIKIGEESGALDDILEKTASFYDEEVDSAIQKLTAMLEPLMIIIMALIIGAIVIAMILPMFDMMNTIQ
ncbi:type II secretion system F family protein [Alkaliphilus pronyensis]|uniref:Type II secretion system F family protein n=1 Tax=Alkaliphilus pronyensis TaxID=1482732 RepID=A0A6I0F4D0_9FIRM|nr:type II secretion system F family protein [Alkaliphilus pronyensis]KAB3537360.1 type II secretion system F family protein [Alkaliphilus pronyensis]